jgi:transcriptional regulator with GAF, ATPase, and Fis domain
MVPTHFDGLTTAGQKPTSYSDAVDHYRRALVVRALMMHGGNITLAAHVLRLTRPAVRYLIDKFHLRREEE